MTDIYEMHLKSGVSIRTLKKLKRLRFLNATNPDNPEIAKMECALRKGNPLGAFYLAILVENPSLIIDLGRYAAKAREQIEALGDAKGEAPHPMIVMTLERAAKDDVGEIERLERWMKRVIPPDREVSHQFLATRALLAISTHSRGYYAGLAAKAFLKVRQRPSFTGWFSLKSTPYARCASFYHRPKLLYDL